MSSAPTSTRSPTRREDRVRRQPALPSGDRGRQLHPRLARQGCSRPLPGGTRSSPSRRRASAGPRRIREALTGLDVEVRTWPAARLSRPPHRLEQRRPPGRGAPARAVRRAPLHRLDVPAAAGWSARDDDPRSRPDPVPRVDDEADAGDARAQVRERGANLRRDLRQLRLHRCGRDGTARRRSRHAFGSPHRASRTCSPQTGRPPTSARPTSSPSRRSSHARTSQALGAGPPPPRRRRLARGRGRRGVGRAARARRPARPPARLRHRRRAGRGSTAAPPSPSIPLASRGSGCRSSRRWPAARRSSRRPTRPWTRRAGDAAVRADPDDPPAIAAAIEEAIARAASALCRPGSSTLRASRGGAAGEIDARGLRGAS